MAYFDKYGVEFSDDRKTLVNCPRDFQGEYIIPDGVEYIGIYAFKECRDLHSVIIPHSVSNILMGAFEDCSQLTSVVLPDGVTICSLAFSGCGSLTVYLPNDVRFDIAEEYEGLGAFECVANIIYKGEITEEIQSGFGGIDGARAINGYEDGDFIYSDTTKTKLLVCLPSARGEITIPYGVQTIGYCAFWGCKNVTKVIIPDTVNDIWKPIFVECDNLKDIEVPIGQEEHFCEMIHSEMQGDEWAEIIRKSAQSRQREAEEQLLIEIQQRQEMLHGATLFFDTETTGILRGFNSQRPVTDSYNWPRLVQLAWMMTDKEGKVLKQQSHIIIPEGFYIPEDAAAVHGITTEKAEREGVLLHDVLEEFEMDLSFAGQIVGHNIDFDQHIVGAELYRLGRNSSILMDKSSTCTMKSSTDFCAIPNPNPYFGGYKWPSLQELYRKLFGHEFSDAHDALADITATKECYFELKRRGIIKE